ncbi:MAG: GNAT family N-acetyltransferase [Ferruginibacter sp.]|nr:GNAT family N-acetyltransferase [Ferruginibacter sp.]
MQINKLEIILEDERVKLVPLSIEHEAAFINYALTEPNTWQYSLVSPGGNADAMKNYIAFAVKEKDENKCYPFTVIDKQTNSIAGCTRFYDIDFNNSAATIGYTWYGEKFRRTGLNRHCKLLMLTHAFEVWNLERVEFRADINNKASINAMKAIGCVEEGVLRSHATIPNGRRTSMILSILKEEWFGGVKENLRKKIY